MTNTENTPPVPTTPAPVVSSPQADVFSAVKRMVVDLVQKANVIAKEVQESRVNVGKAIHDIRKDPETTDEKIKKFQADIAKAEATMEKWTNDIEDYIKKNLVKTSAMSDEVFEAKKAEYAELKKAATASQKLATNLPGFTADIFSDIPALTTLSGGTAGSATGTVRPRLAYLTIDGVDTFVEKANKKTGENEKSYTFTNAASVIAKAAKAKVSPSDLSAAALESAKVTNLSDVNEVEFSYSVNGKNFMILAIPAKGVAAADEKKDEGKTEE